VGDDVLREKSRKAGMSADFPLTRLQRAYVAGRHPDYPWGGLAAHDHRVYRGPLDVERFRAAWRAALGRHDMLRVEIDPRRGTQRVLPEPPATASWCTTCAGTRRRARPPRRPRWPPG